MPNLSIYLTQLFEMNYFIKKPNKFTISLCHIKFPQKSHIWLNLHQYSFGGAPYFLDTFKASEL